ncbi:MAG: PEP/pyruvate-binding domain-containing protein [Candidatus Thiodiazotropha sp.]
MSLKSKIKSTWVYTPNHNIPSTGLVGGKAHNLYKLQSADLPVPNWLCVTIPCFEHCLRFIDFDNSYLLESDNTEAITQYCNKITSAIQSIVLPPVLTDEIHDRLGSGRFAVRSSANCEDSSQYSYAGLFNSYLNVPNELLSKKILSCWSSIYQLSSLKYIQHTGMPIESVRMAVVIQEMKNSKISGVCFSRNPDVTEKKRKLIVAGYGVGEGIVSNRVDTDQYSIDSNGYIYETLRTKKTKLVADPYNNGLVEKQIHESLKDKSVLNKEKINEISSLVDSVTSIMKSDQDIEWLYDHQNKLWLTQTRDITTQHKISYMIFDNSNIVEGYPGKTLPLTVSFIKKAYSDLFTSTMKRLGVNNRKLHNNKFIFDNLLAYVDGHVFYNLTHWYRMLAMLPFPKSIISNWRQAVGIRNSDDIIYKKDKILIFDQILFITKFTVYFFFLDRKLRKLNFRFNHFKDQYKETHLNRKSPKELILLHQYIYLNVSKDWSITLINDLFALLLTGLLRRLCHDWFPDYSLKIFNGLLTSSQQLESSEPLEKLFSLADVVRRDEILRQILSANRNNEMWLDVVLNNNYLGFFREVQDYLLKFGDRAFEELKLESKTFNQEKIRLLTYILEYSAINTKQYHIQNLKSEAETAVKESLSFWKRSILAVVRHFTIRSIAWRESARLNRARAFGLVRTLWSQIAIKLTQYGLLKSHDDIYYLSMDEVSSAIMGNNYTNLNSLVELRKKQFIEYKHNDLEINLIKMSDTLQIMKEQSIKSASDKTLKGIACGHGLIYGEAIIVTDPMSACDVNGKIIVAKSTDPAWVFLMVKAMGLVTEKGSVLSHTAIIGRELGIPTVVNVKDATSIIKNGSFLALDGEKGTVSILKKEDMNELDHTKAAC